MAAGCCVPRVCPSDLTLPALPHPHPHPITLTLTLTLTLALAPTLTRAALFPRHRHRNLAAVRRRRVPVNSGRHARFRRGAYAVAYPAVAHGQRTHTRGAERCALRVGRQPTTKRQHLYARAPTGQARTSSSSACRQSRCRRRSSPRAARGWCSSGAPRGWRPRCGKASRRCSMTRVGPVDLRMTPNGRHETESEAKTRVLRES